MNSLRAAILRDRFVKSGNALDLAGDILDQIAEQRRAGEMLMAYPTDVEERAKLRIAARQTLVLCDRLEGVVS